MNLKNETVVPFIYDNAYSFRKNGLVEVKKDGKYGFIDQTNKVVISFEYDGVGYLGEGFIEVEKDGKKGIIRRMESSR
ncbi:MAG: WG repeat-containing protein [Chitinophagales bacterium]